MMLIKEFIVRIRYTNAQIGDILLSASQNEAYGDLLFVIDCASIQENGDFHSIWNKGVSNQQCLTARDKELLIMLGDKLGETDADGQITFLEMILEMMTKQQQEASENYRQKGRMYRSVGALCGLAVGIMIL